MITEQTTAFNIFVSHKVERDGDAAKELKRLLEGPFFGTSILNVYISRNIEAGQEWRKWINTSLGSSDLLLLLFTDRTLEWDWCLYEAGLFTDLKALTTTDATPNIVCIYPPGKSMPKPLEHLKCVEGSEKGLEQFLKDLFQSKVYGCNPTLSSRIDAHAVDLKRLASEIRSALKFDQKDPVKYGIHLDLIVENPDEIVESRMPQDAKVIGDKEALALFGKSPEPDLRWKDLEKNIEKSRDKKWLEDLATELLHAKAGNLPSAIRSSFCPASQRNGLSLEYIPCIQEKQDLYDKSLRFSIFFSEQPTTARPINSFEDLIDELEHLIQITPNGKCLSMLALTPALGCLAKRDKWKSLRTCLDENLNRIKLQITCLDPDQLKDWHNRFIGRTNAHYEPITVERATEATDAAKKLLKEITKTKSPKFRTYKEMPKFYAFNNDEWAILVTPLFLPSLDDRDDPQDHVYNQNVEMFGLISKDKEMIKKVDSLQRMYWAGGGDGGGDQADAAAI